MPPLARAGMHSPSCTSCFARLCVTVEGMATGSTESIPSCTSRYLLDYPEVGLPTRVPQNADTLRSGDLPPSLQYLDLENFIRQLRTVLHATKWDLHLRNYLYLTREVVSHATLSYIRENEQVFRPQPTPRGRLRGLNPFTTRPR